MRHKHSRPGPWATNEFAADDAARCWRVTVGTGSICRVISQLGSALGDAVGDRRRRRQRTNSSTLVLPVLLRAVVAVAFSGACGGETERAREQPTTLHDVVIDERVACRFVVGRTTPSDVIDIFGWPITRGASGQTAISSLVYMHRDPFSPLPDIVYFMFRRRSGRSPERLIGGFRVTGAGPYGFSCLRDTEGNEVQPLALAP